MVKLEVGKHYLTRDGRKVGPMKKGKWYGWYDRSRSITSQPWGDDGGFIRGIDSPFDLVNEAEQSPKIIALSGLAGSGKSTAAKYLVEEHGFTLVKFATPLKNMLRAIGLTEREIEGDLKEVPNDKLCGRTPRYAMQQLGTEYGRNIIGVTFWTTLWEREAQRYGRVVCDDCRFENEAAVIREMNGTIVGITGRGGIAGTHESENGVTPDMTVDNSGDVKNMYRALDILVSGL